MRTAVEISMYPLTGDYRPAIQAFIDRLHLHEGLRVETNALSTQVWGELAHVMSVVGAEIERAAVPRGAERAAQLVFVMKILPGLAAP